jgi:hypothetical protein
VVHFVRRKVIAEPVAAIVYAVKLVSSGLPVDPTVLRSPLANNCGGSPRLKRIMAARHGFSSMQTLQLEPMVK